MKDPENKLWSKETEDIPEIREIWTSIKRLEYKDEPDYNFIRGRLKQIYERSQYVPRWNNHPNDTSDMDIARPMGYYRESVQPRVTYPQYQVEKSYIPPHPAPVPEYMNHIRQAPVYNQPIMSQNYSIGMAAPPPIPHPAQTPTLPRMPLPEYEPRETNVNVSLNQILRLPYQIMMPPTAEINQSISISNLPSLNDLAFRTGINNSVSTLVHKGVCYPTGNDLILPISTIYSKNCPKYHPTTPEIHWESKLEGRNPMEVPQKYYNWGQREFMQKEEPRGMNNYYNLPPPQPIPTPLHQNNTHQRSYTGNPSFCYPSVEPKTD